MKKKANQTAWTFGIISTVILLFFVGGFWVVQSFKNTADIIINGYYDENGNEIGFEQSLIGGVDGVKFITLQLSAKNEDEVPLNISISKASPIEFLNSLPDTTIEVQPGKKALWVTDLIDIEQYEGQNVTYTVEITAESRFRKTTTKMSNYTFEVLPDKDGAFSIDIIQGSENEQGIDPEEEQEEEPEQSTESVFFRTTDSNYDSGSAIAYAEQCGQELKKYGKTSGACTEFNCNDANYDFLGVGNKKVFIRNAGELCVCTTSSRPLRYDVDDSDAGKVSKTTESIDNSLELTC